MAVLVLRQTLEFNAWLRALKDRTARAKINVRLLRLAQGNPGDVKAVGEGVSEIRIDSGPGYRIYFVRHGRELIVILHGGDKSGQSRDIAKAKKLAANLRDLT